MLKVTQESNLPTKIEYVEDDINQTNTGWWILDFNKLDDEPFLRTGPFATRLRALEMLRISNEDQRSRENKNEHSTTNLDAGIPTDNDPEDYARGDFDEKV